ncbi:MAG: transporter associated domain-containing protein [Gammaproteobacteria bacterium]|jgi:magnesium and cobalt transporter
MSNDEPPSRGFSAWLDTLKNLFNREPQNREDLLDTLQLARDQSLIDMDAQSMIEGVLAVSDLRVRDIMIPRAEMAVIGRDDTLEQVLPVVIESAHSRFPVIGEDRAEVVGIMLAKDLLQYCGENAKKFNIRDVVRKAVFVPESKRLNVLLKEFQTNRNHMAVVIDEYGTAAGLVTIEDVLEQIVGEIEDEHDFDDDVMILQRSEHEFTIKAQLDIDDFNERFDTDFSDEEFDTIGGIVTKAFGHLPKSGETVVIDRFEFRVIRADSRKIRLLAVSLEPETVDE